MANFLKHQRKESAGRHANAIAQRVIAEHAGLTLDRYYRIEAGKTLPSVDEEARLVRAFNIERRRHSLAPITAKQLGLTTSPTAGRRGRPPVKGSVRDLRRRRAELRDDDSRDLSAIVPGSIACSL